MHAEKHVLETAQETGECMKAFASFLFDFSFPPSNILAPLALESSPLILCQMLTTQVSFSTQIRGLALNFCKKCAEKNYFHRVLLTFYCGELLIFTVFWVCLQKKKPPYAGSNLLHVFNFLFH